ncbi:REP-associated tyrosine transposase [Pelagovum pacificum]|uniref:Transposase n=1 Tax=Pelagovum pacificum TaxID=2588711 RepID=A0A5C5GF23_9RHOB|nr:hypothetical protein [Pelagovum pacificum]QQA43749.1 hypothetical protein I8N54_04005 [Pelagovum pacificum]TNY33120.1 hypothetical protein FHY64_07530 [Pelagovum pacificum]
MRAHVQSAPATFRFCTLSLSREGDRLLIEHLDLFRASYWDEVRRRPLVTDCIVVLPDHLHAIWSSAGSVKYTAGRWSRIKAGFTRRLKSRTGVRESPWMPGVLQHRIRSLPDLEAHRRLIWTNPVRHNLVPRPEDWLVTSLHRDLREGRVDDAWMVALGAGPAEEPRPG